MSSHYLQRFFSTYDDEYKYTLEIIKRSQELSEKYSYPGLFHKVISIIDTATADKHRGLVSILPELIQLFRDEGLPYFAEEYITYARYISDVTSDGHLRQPEPEEGDNVEEDDEIEEAPSQAGPSQQARTRVRKHKTRAKNRNSGRDINVKDISVQDIPQQAKVESSDTECEEQPAETPQKVAPAETITKKVASGVSKRRKRPASGLLPQRKSVRQWNKLSAGEDLNAEWVLTDGPAESRGQDLISVNDLDGQDKDGNGACAVEPAMVPERWCLGGVGSMIVTKVYFIVSPGFVTGEICDYQSYGSYGSYRVRATRRPYCIQII